MSKKKPFGYVESQYEIEYTAQSRMLDLANADKSPIEVTIRAELIVDCAPGQPKIYRSDKKFLFHNIDDMISKTGDWYTMQQILFYSKQAKEEILMEVFKR